MQTDNIALAEQLIHIHLLDFRWQLEVGFRSQCVHLHTESDSNTRCGISGVSQSYQTDFLLAQFHQRSVPKTEILVVCPTAFVHFFGVVLHLLSDVQDIRKYHLSNGSGAV